MKYIAVLIACGMPAFVADAGVTTALFEDFSGLSYGPSSTTGQMVSDAYTMDIVAGPAALDTDLSNGYDDALLVSSFSTNTTFVTFTFNTEITRVRFNFDAMHQSQNDGTSASIGSWDTNGISTLSVIGQRLESIAPVVNPGGDGIDDNLNVDLIFDAPVTSFSLTDITGAWVIDTVTMTVVPVPSTALLFGMAALPATRRRR